MKVEFDKVVSLFDKHNNALLDEKNTDKLLKKAKRLSNGKEDEDDITLALSKWTKAEVSL